MRDRARRLAVVDMPPLEEWTPYRALWAAVLNDAVQTVRRGGRWAMADRAWLFGRPARLPCAVICAGLGITPDAVRQAVMRLGVLPARVPTPIGRPRQCTECGETFQPVRANQRYCSASHGDRARARRRRTGQKYRSTML